MYHMIFYYTISYYNFTYYGMLYYIYTKLKYVMFCDVTYTCCLQDIWLRRHVAALDSVVSLYCNPAELANKAFATDKVFLHF